MGTGTICEAAPIDFLQLLDLIETLIVAFGRSAEPPLRAVLERFGIEIVPLTERRAEAAAATYRRYGRRFGPADLNLGDCFAYALAKEHDCPLLFVGDDFARTDVRPALEPSTKASR